MAGAVLRDAAFLVSLNYTSTSYDAFLFERGRSPDANATRAAHFAENLRMIREHNARYAAGLERWYMGLNEFADWSPAERRRLRKRQKHLGILVPDTPRSRRTALSDLEDGSTLPTAVDWRTKNVSGLWGASPSPLGPVNTQGSCGACWAFSATQTLEAHLAIATGKHVRLSAQSLLDCVDNQLECGGKGGCDGAIEELGYEHAKTHGVPLEDDYAYTARDGACNTTVEPAVFADGYVKLPRNEALPLQRALATVGPVSISVAAGAWDFYGGGVFDGCTGNEGAEQDHGVQAVGYTKDAWIIKNSWGADWGEKGYIYLSRANDTSPLATDHNPAVGSACKDAVGGKYPETVEVRGMCACLSDSSYPTGVRAADGLLQRVERREAGFRRLAAADVGRGRRRAAPGVLMPK